MTEETAVRIVEKLDSIVSAVWSIIGLIIFFGIAILAYMLTKD